MNKINLKINGEELSTEKGKTILQVARENNIYVPTLCYLEGINKLGGCRICLVEIEGQKNLQPSCTFPAQEGMVVYTNSSKVRKARRNVLELILSNHPQDCLKCSRNQSCELQKLSADLGITEVPFQGETTYGKFDNKINENATSIVRNPDMCILCRRCVAVCSSVQEVGILSAVNRGFNTTISTAFDHPLDSINCTLCGQCINVCPVSAIKEKDNIEDVWQAINDPSKHVIVQTAPSVRATLGEEFGMPIGTNVTGKMVTALRMLGFDKVFDTDFSADLTIIEEGYEFINRFKENKNLPLITSCSPGWIKYCEHHYPEFIDNISTCKSPQQMFGSLAKTYYPEISGIDVKDVYSVAIMPCTAKKFEASREEINTGEYKDVDAVLTIREFAKMIKSAGINFNELENEEFDLPMGESTGAGAIFGTTGGVMEAALRTVSEILTDSELENIEFDAVRGIQEGLKEAEIKIGDAKIKVAVAHGLKNAKIILEKIKNGEKYHFIEIMACPGGCIGGGGTPLVSADKRAKLGENYLKVRARAIYDVDCQKELRKSHENPYIKKLYSEFLGEPAGEKAHKILHTHYVKRDRY